MTKTFSLQVKNPPSFSMTVIEQRVVLNYVRIQTNSNKFYILEFQEGVGDCPYRIYINYGRLGRTPRRHERYFRSRMEARKDFDRTLTSKRKKGYELILIEEDWDDYSDVPISESISNQNTRSPSIDTPLGKLSEVQIRRGIQILSEIEQGIYNGCNDVINLSNQFYSVIPVAFGSQIDKNSCVFDTLEKVEAKKDWLHQMITLPPLFE